MTTASVTVVSTECRLSAGPPTLPASDGGTATAAAANGEGHLRSVLERYRSRWNATGLRLSGGTDPGELTTSFARLAGEMLLAPLGMEHTTHDPAVVMTYPLMQHHAASGGQVQVLHLPKAGVRHQPAGLRFSTVGDLARLGALHLRQSGRSDEPDRAVRVSPLTGALGFTTDPHTGEVTHLHLNGCPYRRSGR